MSDRLPTPISRTDQLLVVLIERVDALRADLAAARGGEPAPAEPGKTLLEEPTSSGRKPRSSSRTKTEETP